MFPLGLPLLVNLKAGHLHLLSTTLNAFKEVLNNYTIYYWSQVMNNFKYLVSCQYLWVVKFRIEGRRRVLTVTRVIRASYDGSFTGRDCKALNKDTILKSFSQQSASKCLWARKWVWRLISQPKTFSVEMTVSKLLFLIISQPRCHNSQPASRCLGNGYFGYRLHWALLIKAQIRIIKLKKKTRHFKLGFDLLQKHKQDSLNIKPKTHNHLSLTKAQKCNYFVN